MRITLANDNPYPLANERKWQQQQLKLLRSVANFISRLG